MNPTIFAALRNVLARLFSDESSIRRIVDDAGLDQQRIDFGSSAINVWHFVLTEAEKVDRVEALLQVVDSEGYGDNREFQDAYQAYRQSQGKQDDLRQHTNVSTHQLKPHTPTRQQRLPSVLIGIALIGLVGGAYWMLGGSQFGGNITPTVTAAISASGASEEKSAEGSSTPTELPTATVAAVSPSPTSIATVATATTTPTPTVNIPQPTNTPPEVASALCSFAFLVLDEQSEEPIRRATIAVFVGVRQDTGTTDSNGYYLTKLPCRNEQDVEAQVRVSADDYIPYNTSVFLSNETKEILLKRQATPTLNATPTATFTLIPTPQPTATLTPMPTPSPTPEPCTATVISLTGATEISLRDSAAGGATSRRIPVGEIVLIINPNNNGSPYHQVIYSAKKYRGWLPADNLELSPACEN